MNKLILILLFILPVIVKAKAQHIRFDTLIHQYALVQMEDAYGNKTDIRGGLVVVTIDGQTAIVLATNVTDVILVNIKNIEKVGRSTIYYAEPAACGTINGQLIYDLYPKIVIYDNYLEIYACQDIIKFKFRKFIKDEE
jgi:hypothetical protein